MRLSFNFVTPFLVAAVAVACSSSENSPGGQGGTSQTPKGGNAGTSNASGGTGTSSGGNTGTPQGGSNPNSGGKSASGGQNSNSGGSTQGGSSNSSGGQNSNSGGSTQGGSSNNSGGQNSNSGGSTQGGSSNNSGGSSAGGAAPGATELKCNDSVYGAVTIPAAAVISDFETNTLQQYVQEGRGDKAEPWYAYASGDVNTATGETMTPSVVNPKNAANKFVVETTEHGPCSTKGALHVSSPGQADGYAGFGIDFMARTAARKKQSYDASKYTGVGFWAKCKNDLQFAFFKVPDAKQDADIDPAPCSYSTDPKCNQYGIKNATITNQWTYYKLYFSELLQDPNGKNFGTGVDKSKLTAFQIHVNPFSPRNPPAVANAFDCYIDDVHFLTEPAPTVPAETVTWSTSGNKLMRNGKEYRIRGLVRPSMEWDYAGFGVTREDIQRMKKWHANSVRLAVKDTLWAGGSTGSASGDGMAYQRNVKRVVNWVLQQGMDVILDLHYVAGSPTSAHTDFWDAVSKDSFFKDGRIIFELYNEPTADFNALRSWHVSTLTKIRANGAKNLVLVSGVDYSYDISGYGSNPITGQDPIAYVTHPYTFKTTPGDQTAFLTPASKLPVVATEFGDANVEGFRNIPPTQCDASLYSGYISKFESAGMSWTSWAWIVDAWGCGFPQLIANYSGEPNAIGTPVREQLIKLNP